MGPTAECRPPSAECPSVVEALVRIAARAGRRLWIPEDARGICCGVPFSSKGFDAAHAVAANRTVERLWAWSDRGRLPIVIDTSPCTLGVRGCREALARDNRKRFDRLTVVDVVEFVHDLLPLLEIEPLAGTSVVHPVCSVVRMGLAGQLETIVAKCSERCVVPPSAGCCGFAGDRGFLVPELTRAALEEEAAEVRALEADRHVSSSRTCEIGLTRATGRAYESFVHLVDAASCESGQTSGASAHESS
jgi:D-lactate dehydrogenase